KGTTRPLSRPAFLSECWTLLGIPGYYCINEYGMTELCSQRYDSALDDRFHGRSLAPRRLVGPPWLRTRVLDPDPLAPVAPEARARLRRRPLGDTVAALAAAAARWRDDPALRAELPAAARLSPAMIAAVVPIAAEALDAVTMTMLIERTWGAGAARRPAPDGPALVAHVVARNVPALALPAIALGCLAGAAVLVKSGRDDPLSAPAFQRALAAVDAQLAATIVTTYW